jgi:hypothetical protein
MFVHVKMSNALAGTRSAQVHLLMYKIGNVLTRTYIYIYVYILKGTYTCFHGIYMLFYIRVCTWYTCINTYIRPCTSYQMYIHVYTMYIQEYTRQGRFEGSVEENTSNVPCTDRYTHFYRCTYTVEARTYTDVPFLFQLFGLPCWLACNPSWLACNQ